MKAHLPVFKRWLGCAASDILDNILSRSLLCVLGVNDLASLIKLQDIGKNRINLLKGARLLKNAGIIDSFQQGMTDALVCYPKRKCPDSTAD